jgi:hypothetical protein
MGNVIPQAQTNGSTALPRLRRVGNHCGCLRSQGVFAHLGFVIALHSPNGVAETELRICLPEKKAAKLASGVQRDTFSGAV